MIWRRTARRDGDRAAGARLAAEAAAAAGARDRAGLEAALAAAATLELPAEQRIEIAKAAAALELPGALEAAARAAGERDALPIHCEHAAIALRIGGPLASLQALAGALAGAGAARDELLRHAGYAVRALDPAAAEPARWLAAAEDPRLAGLTAPPLAAWPERALAAAEAWTPGGDEAAVAALMSDHLLRLGEAVGPAALDAFAERGGPAVAAAALEHWLARGELEAARRLLRRAPEVGATGPGLVLRRRLGLADWPELRLGWTRRLTEAPVDARLRDAFARELAAEGEREEALYQARAAWLLRPGEPAAGVALAEFAAGLGDWDLAAEGAEAALADAPGDARALAALARVRAAQGREAEAERLAAEAAADTRTPVLERAWLLEGAGRLARAAELAMAAGDDAAAAEQAVRLGAIAVLTGTAAPEGWLARIADLARARVAVLPPERLCEAATALAVAGRDAEARATWAAALAAGRGPELAASGQFAPMAHRLADPVLRAQPQDAAAPAALRALAARLAETGTPDLAAVALTMAALAAPEDQALALAAGLALLGRGETGAAEALFARVRRVEGRDAREASWPGAPAGRWPEQPRLSPEAWAERLPAGVAWPRISVVTPSFNQARFLEDTLRSIEAQAYPNLQLIVVDGGSTDGSLEILRRWRRRIDVLIVGRDRGQTDALNLGFARADGELLCWLNSDDLFAPGALRRAAVAWLESGADLVAGMALAFRDGRIETANLPAARAATFTVAGLADLAAWNRGEFFYQPEVLFTRALFQRLGGRLDDRLDCVMDYEFWLRCAEAGAKLEVVPWPVALFRHHAGQKSGDQAACLAEQAEVRDRFLVLGPPPERAAAVRAALGRALRRRGGRLALVGAKLPPVEAPRGWRVETAATPEAAAAADLLVWRAGPGDGPEALAAWRAGSPDGVAVVWLARPEDHPVAALELASAADVTVPGGPALARYLATDRALQTAPLAGEAGLDALLQRLAEL